MSNSSSTVFVAIDTPLNLDTVSLDPMYYLLHVTFQGLPGLPWTFFRTKRDMATRHVLGQNVSCRFPTDTKSRTRIPRLQNLQNTSSKHGNDSRFLTSAHLCHKLETETIVTGTGWESKVCYVLSRDTINAGIRTRTMSRTALQAEYPPEPNHTSL